MIKSGKSPASPGPGWSLRHQWSRLPLWWSLLAAGAALLLVVLVILCTARSPAEALGAFFVRPFTNTYLLGNLLDTAVITGIAGLGFAFGRRSGMFNLGSEGFLYGGALITALLAPGLSGWGLWGMAVLALAALGAGICTGMAAHVLKSRLQIHEIISTYLMSVAVISLGDSLLSGPLRNPQGNLLSSPPLSPDLVFGCFFSPSTLNAGAFVSPLVAFVMYLYLKTTRQGYELKILEANPELARSQGIHASRHYMAGLAVSGGLSFLAGNFLVSGSHHAAFTGISGGLGWNGIAAAMLARNHPLGCIFAAVFLAWIQAGFRSAVLFTDLGLNSALIMQGLVILLVSAGMASKGRSQ